MAATVLDTRIISGKGVLKVPDTSDRKKAKILLLYADVIREPTSEYMNYKYNPPQSFYGYVCGLTAGYVQWVKQIAFNAEMWMFDSEAYLQTMYAVGCSESALRQTIVQLGVTGIESPVGTWRHNQLWVDEFRVVCFADTAIRLVLKSIPFDFCGSFDSDPPNEPPEPPEPPVKYPPGTPLEDTDTPVSPPYDPTTSDGGNTSPYPGDEESVDPPEGTPVWTVVTSARTFKIVSPSEPELFSNQRCTVERGLQAFGLVGRNDLTPYCGEFTNYCLFEGETIVSATITEYCTDVFP